MNALLLSVYFLVVFYVLYQMALALEDKLEDKVEIRFDNAFAAEQTQAQLDAQPDARHTKAFARTITFGKKDDKKKGGKPKPKKPVVLIIFDTDKKVDSSDFRIEPLRLMGMSEDAIQEKLQPKVIIRIDPVGKERLRSIPHLVLSVQNETADRQIYLYWDRSSIEMFGQGNRIVRSTPTLPVDLMQGQIFSVVNPGQRVVSNISIEKNYARNPDTGKIERAQPLLDLTKRVEMSKMTDPTEETENIQPLCGLDLMLGYKHAIQADSKMLNLLVPISLELVIKVDQIAFPPLRWFNRNFGRRKPEGSWWLGRPKKNRRSL